jgi:Ni/Fe-hydrogenase subunit HybB-like protein
MTDTVRGDAPVIGSTDYAGVTASISRIALEHPGTQRWLICFAGALALLSLFLAALFMILLNGPGVWGNNIPVGWAFDIINYVWWIGIGNAGTLISAALLLFRQRWRNALNRFAETMTLLAASCAAIYPIIHLGRPWYFYWNLPYPNTMLLWPQFRSPLVWDAMALVVYLTLSLLFWYVGMIPDLATLRDAAPTITRRKIYGVFALGWRGDALHWKRWEQAYHLLAGLAVALVVSVHSGVGMLFSVGLEPGWHTTLMAPFFVFGAMFSGFAVVAMIAITLRYAFAIKDLVTERHLNALGLLVLGTGLATSYGYIIELFTTWYGGDAFERSVTLDRFIGPYAWSYWGVVLCNVLAIQPLWSPRIRRSPVALFAISFIAVIGMWFERFMIIVITLHHDFLPSSAHFYAPSFWEISTFLGTIGIFLTFMLLFVRYLPIMSMFELRPFTMPDRADLTSAKPMGGGAP